MLTLGGAEISTTKKRYNGKQEETFINIPSIWVQFFSIFEPC